MAVPESLVDYVIKECHDSPTAGHMGITKTLALVRSRFWWPTWRIDVTQYIKECPSCQVHKPLTGKPHSPLLPLEIPKEPWESVSIDFVVELPTTASGYDTLMVFVDQLTKMVHLVKHYKRRYCTVVHGCLHAQRLTFAWPPEGICQTQIRSGHLSSTHNCVSC